VFAAAVVRVARTALVNKVKGSGQGPGGDPIRGGKRLCANGSRQRPKESLAALARAEVGRRVALAMRAGVTASMR
jgi:hypothetical protein